ncbi:MAG: hypothetical protein ABIG20_04175 [archaeon]
MTISKAATIGVFVTIATLVQGFDPVWAFAIGGIGVTAIYRGLKGCLNFINPMALTGAGATVLVFGFTGDWVPALVGGMIVSLIVGILVPA